MFKLTKNGNFTVRKVRTYQRVVLSRESEDVFAMMKIKKTNNGLQIRQHTDPATRTTLNTILNSG
jgi:uncharacterized membrane protein